MTLHIVAAAKREMQEAADWYEQRLTGLGNDFLTEVEHALGQIERDPKRFPQLETISDDAIRRTMLDRFPFVIVFECDGDQVRVLAIAHTRRRPGYWKQRRNL